MHVSSLLQSCKEGILMEDCLKLISYLLKILFSPCSISIFMYRHFSFRLPVTFYLLPLSNPSCSFIFCLPQKGAPFGLCSGSNLKALAYASVCFVLSEPLFHTVIHQVKKKIMSSGKVSSATRSGLCI